MRHTVRFTSGRRSGRVLGVMEQISIGKIAGWGDVDAANAAADAKGAQAEAFVNGAFGFGVLHGPAQPVQQHEGES